MNATESNAMKHAQLLFCLGVLMISATAALAKPDRLREILFEGSKRARAIAQQTMARVRDAVKIPYR